ncbi:hypothetical protein SH2C18_35350 [Clostridium sediminicola]|uniref:hypothetical protein n=1 Tax=Clostridium sediminicola TaxID=3114879 RepID=UPI0031F245DB
MCQRLFKSMLYGAFMGSCVVLGRWIMEYIFNPKLLPNGYFCDFIIGVCTFMILSLVSEFLKIRKEKEGE